MTERECGWCGALFPRPIRERRPKLYCSRSCRQRAYEWRHGIAPGRLTERVQPGFLGEARED